MRRRAAVSCGLLVLVLAASGTAQAGWGSPESVGTDINNIQLAPGGPGFVVGFGATNPSRLRFALRPLDGVVGTPMEFPGATGQLSVPFFGFDAAGDAVIINREGRLVAYRQANGTLAGPQDLGLGKYPAMMSVAPTGEAIIGLNPSGGGPVQVAFRPAGLDAQVDTNDTLDLSQSGALVGLQLQADGGAIVVWQEGDTLKQVVRRSGQTLFDTPVTIPSPGDPRKFQVVFSGDPSGWAMLAWMGSSTMGGAVDQAIGSVRAPDGTFPTGTVLATGIVINPAPAVTASGDGLVAWQENGLGGPSCPVAAIRGALQHHGTWSAPIALGPAAWPDFSIEAGGAYAGGAIAMSSGDDVSVKMIKIHHTAAAPCPPYPQERSLIVHHFRSDASGLTDQGTSELSPPGAGQPLVDGGAMEPGGKIFAWYQVDTARYLNVFDGVTPGGGSTTTTTTTMPGPGVTTTTTTMPPLQPIVAQRFVTIAPIDPKALELEMTCPGPGNEPRPDICAGRARAYYLLTGKALKPHHGGVPAEATTQKITTRQVLIASGELTLQPGQTGRLKLTLNRTGKHLLHSGRKLKVSIDFMVTVGARTGTTSFDTTILKRKRH